MTRVLVVDDNPQVRLLVGRVVASLGCAVVEAASCEEALREALTGPVDLLVTDVTLQGPSGLHVADEVRRVHSNARVLYVSGHDEGQVARMAAGAGLPQAGLATGEAFLRKPFALADLRGAVQALLSTPSTPPSFGGAS